MNHSAKLRFEEFAYRVMAEARQCRATEIFKLGGKVYAFDSSTIDLCLSVFSWALLRKKKGGIKLHTLYDIETQIPTFFHITPARNHDTRAMDAIPYEENSFYIFDRAYNDFGRLFTIDGVGAYFVVRGKKNNDFEQISREDQTDTVPGSGVRQDFHLLHKRPEYKPVEGGRTVPQQVADRAVLQMAEAAP